MVQHKKVSTKGVKMPVNFPRHILPDNCDFDEEIPGSGFSLVCSICRCFSKLFNIDMAAPCEFH